MWVGLDLATRRDVTAFVNLDEAYYRAVVRPWLTNFEARMGRDLSLTRDLEVVYAAAPRLTREDVARFYDVNVTYIG